MSFLSHKGIDCVCVRERERVCFHSIDRSILFSQNLKKSNRVLKLFENRERVRLLINSPPPSVCVRRLFTVCKDL